MGPLINRVINFGYPFRGICLNRPVCNERLKRNCRNCFLVIANICIHCFKSNANRMRPACNVLEIIILPGTILLIRMSFVSVIA